MMASEKPRSSMTRASRMYITPMRLWSTERAGQRFPPTLHRWLALSFISAGDATMASEKAGPALANVLYAIKDSIAYVTVNRAKVLNALNTPTWSDLRKAFEDARDDAAIRGVILTGAGDKAFIAGADI